MLENTLLQAAKGNDTASMEALLNGQMPIDINEVDDEGNTLLAIAAASGSNEVVALLLAKDAEVDICDKLKRTPLMHAAKAGRANIVKQLLEHGANVDHADKWKHTPIFYAILACDIDCVRQLLQKGADLNHISDHNYKPINFANFSGRLPALNCIFEDIQTKFCKKIDNLLSVEPNTKIEEIKESIEEINVITDCVTVPVDYINKRLKHKRATLRVNLIEKLKDGNKKIQSRDAETQKNFLKLMRALKYDLSIIQDNHGRKKTAMKVI